MPAAHGPAAVIAEVHRRIDALGDPGIFLHLIDRERSIAEAEALGELRSRRGRSGACRSPSRTTSTWPAARRRRPVRPSPIGPRGRTRWWSRGCVRPGRIPVGQDQPRPVRDRPRRHCARRTRSPRNALDPAIVPGGSSSGSAVAVARGLVAFALGTDTAGSGRVPAALNNIVGLKPSLGAISTRGVVPACRTLDAVSVFALTVDDAWAAFARGRRLRRGRPVLARDRGAAARRAAAAPARSAFPSRASRRFFGDAAQERAFDADLRTAGGAGRAAASRSTSRRSTRSPALLYAGPWVAERHAVLEALLARDPEAVHPVVARHRRARRRGSPRPTRSAASTGSRRTARARSRPCSRRSTCSACRRSRPSTRSATSPPTRSARTRGSGPIPTSSTCSGSAASRCRRRREPTAGRAASPCSPRAGRDALLASLGRRIEAWATAGSARPAGRCRRRAPSRRPPARTRSSSPSAARTCPACRSTRELTRLGGALPARGAHHPGLPPLQPARRSAASARPAARAGRRRDRARGLGAADGRGSATSSPASRPRSASAPSTLADGTAPKGFLCEPAGVVGAEDVTALGDWRRVVAEAAA